MIETYKIVTGKYQSCVAPTFYEGSVYVTTPYESKRVPS